MSKSMMTMGEALVWWNTANDDENVGSPINKCIEDHLKHLGKKMAIIVQEFRNNMQAINDNELSPDRFTIRLDIRADARTGAPYVSWAYLHTYTSNGIPISKPISKRKRGDTKYPPSDLKKWCRGSKDVEDLVLKTEERLAEIRLQVQRLNKIKRYGISYMKTNDEKNLVPGEAGQWKGFRLASDDD